MMRSDFVWRDEDDAEHFARQLFKHVLRNEGSYESAIMAWSNRALRDRDPLHTFRAFIEVEEHQNDLVIQNDTRTRWPNGHFYSPVVSRNEISKDRDRIFKKTPVVGIDFQDEKQIVLLHELSVFFASVPFFENRTDKFRYGYNNPSYNYGDAIIYWSMINHLRPGRILEIGSGFSSALALDTIELLGLPTACTFVDPYPQVAREATAPLRAPHRIIGSRVQDIDPTEFLSLEHNDILFIDSSHVLKSGSDVHFELCEILPRLKAGVLVHFHDMFDNFEYPEKWVLEENHSWNELYAVRLFLTHNDNFSIEYFNDYIAKNYAAILSSLAPTEAPRILLNPGGGLWLRRQ